MTTTITILCGIGEYTVPLPPDVDINDLPMLLEARGGIVVPLDIEDVPSFLFIPAAEIQGITWPVVVAEVPDVEPEEDLAEVSIIGDQEPGSSGKVGENGEQWLDG